MFGPASGPLPDKLQFLTVLLFAPLLPFKVTHITALAALALLFLIVKSLLAETAGHTLFTVLPVEPSITTLSAPFNLITAELEDVSNTIPVLLGLIVSV